MKAAPLPPEIVSLIHYTELNKSGWWNKSIQQLVLSAIWLLRKSIPQTLAGVLTQSFHIDIPVQRLMEQCEQLIRSGSLIRVPKGDLSLSEASKRKLEDELHQNEELTVRVRSQFTEVFAKSCPTSMGLTNGHYFTQDS